MKSVQCRYETGIVCVSGGLDSAVTASVAARECRNLLFLHVNYGQRTESREKECFRLLARDMNAQGVLEADIGYLAQIGGSSLVDHSMEIEPADLERTGIPSSYVPFRNAHLLSIAVSWAETCGAEAIYIGAVEEDSSGYPDCRREFYDAFQRLAEIGTKPETRIQILTPVIGLSKEGIVRLGLDLGTPFEHTWSCYRSDERACGECDSCALRLRGFAKAGKEDPIPYKKRPIYTQ